MTQDSPNPDIVGIRGNNGTPEYQGRPELGLLWKPPLLNPVEGLALVGQGVEGAGNGGKPFDELAVV